MKKHNDSTETGTDLNIDNVLANAAATAVMLKGEGHVAAPELPMCETSKKGQLDWESPENSITCASTGASSPLVGLPRELSSLSLVSSSGCSHLTRKIELYNSSYAEIQLDEASVNNVENTSYKSFKMEPFEFLDNSQVEYVKTSFQLSGIKCLLEESFLKQAMDLEILDQTKAYADLYKKEATANCQTRDVTLPQFSADGPHIKSGANKSYLALPKLSTTDSRPWASVKPLEIIQYVFDRESHFECSIMAHLTEQVSTPTLCGPVAKNFTEGGEIVVTTSCLSRYTQTKAELYFTSLGGNSTGAVVPHSLSVEDFTNVSVSKDFECPGTVTTTTTLAEQQLWQQPVALINQLNTDSDDNGLLATYLCPKMLSISAKAFHPAMQREAPFGIYVNDVFLKENGCRYGDIVACFDEAGTYHRDVLKESPFPELSYATGYATGGNVDIQVVSVHADQPRGFST